MSVFMNIGLLYDLSIFIFGMFYWDVFYCAWQGPMEEQSCTEWFFTLYKYIWKKKKKKLVVVYIISILDKMQLTSFIDKWSL